MFWQSPDDGVGGQPLAHNIMLLDLRAGNLRQLGTQWEEVNNPEMFSPDQKAWAFRPDLRKSWALRLDSSGQAMVLIEQDWAAGTAMPVAQVPLNLGKDTPFRLWTSDDGKTIEFLDGAGNFCSADTSAP